MLLSGRLSVLAAVILACVVLECGSQEPQTVTICGSTTLEPLIKKASAVFGQGKPVTFNLAAPGSRKGISEFIAGKCDLTPSSTTMDSGEIARAEQAGIKLKSFLLGYDIIVPIVHPANPVGQASLQQLQDVFAGKIKNWEELGGNDEPIQVVNRDQNSGTFDVWRTLVADITGLGENPVVLPSNSSVLAHVVKHPQAIGYISSVFLNPEIKSVSVDAVDLNNRKTIIEKYPLKRPLYLYVDEKRFTGIVREFIIYLLMDENGRKLIEKTGFFAAPAPDKV